ncbi:MAG: phage holin family protein [Myxococcota bacterium]|nr:phage holin family protein [Myxococcota bacterium]
MWYWHVNGLRGCFGDLDNSPLHCSSGPRARRCVCWYPRPDDRPLEPPLDTALARRLIWNVLPAALVIGAVYVTVAGEAGLLARHTLKKRVQTTERAVSVLREQNAHKRARIAALKRDPRALQRAAAEELLAAPAGSTVYRFAKGE